MSTFHGFPFDEAPRLFTETIFPNVTCIPPYSRADEEGVTRYPRLLSRWTCQGCGAVWQYDRIGYQTQWRLVALPRRETDQ